MHKTACCSKRDRDYNQQDKNHKKVVFSECALTKPLTLNAYQRQELPQFYELSDIHAQPKLVMLGYYFCSHRCYAF